MHQQGALVHNMFKTLKKNKYGFSIVEVVIAAVIFSIATVGLFSAISMTRPKAVGSSDDIEGLFRARQKIDELSALVSADQWTNSSSLLAPGTYNATYNRVYLEWTITNNPVTGGRDISMTINII